MKRTKLHKRVLLVGFYGGVVYIFGIVITIIAIAVSLMQMRFLWPLFITGFSFLINGFVMEVISELGVKVIEMEKAQNAEIKTANLER